MPPEVLEKLLAKLDQVEPISKEDLLKALLGNEETSLNISKEIKKVVSNIDTLAELEIERTFQKVNERLPGDLTKILSKLDQTLDSQSKKIITDLTNKEPEIKPFEEIKPQVPKSTIKTFEEFKAQEIEITLSRKSVNDLKKIFGGVLNDTFKGLETATTEGDGKLEKGLSGLSKIISERNGPLFDLFGLGTLGRMLKPILTGVLVSVTGLSLLLGSFGKDLTAVIDKIFNTNLSLVTRVFQKFVPVQETDFFTKWSARFLASRKFGETSIDIVSPIVKRVPLVGGLISSLFGPLYRGIASTLTGKNVVEEGSKTGIKVTEEAAELAAKQAAANAAQKAIYDREKAALMRGQGFKLGLTEEEAVAKLAKEGVSETAPLLTKEAAKGGGLLVKILTKFGVSGAERVLTKIPFGVGAVLGLGFGAERIMRGDYVSGILQIASGIASIFPGIGTAISLGLDVLDIGLEVGAPQFKKSANKFLWQNLLKNVPIFDFLRNVGYHLDSNRPWLALFDIMRLSPGMTDRVNSLETLLATDIEEKIVAGKPIDYTSLAQMVRKNMWKSISPYIPEMWGLKKWFAEVSGLTDETIPFGEILTPPFNPEKPPTIFIPAATNPQSQPQSQPPPQPGKTLGELHEGDQGKNKGIWLRNRSSLSLANFKPMGYSSDEDFNKITSVFEDPGKDLKNYLGYLHTTVSDMSNSFKDFSKTMKESNETPSVVSIDASTQNSGGGESYLTGSRDHIFDWRTFSSLSLNGS